MTTRRLLRIGCTYHKICQIDQIEATDGGYIVTVNGDEHYGDESDFDDNPVQLWDEYLCNGMVNQEMEDDE